MMVESSRLPRRGTGARAAPVALLGWIDGSRRRGDCVGNAFVPAGLMTQGRRSNSWRCLLGGRGTSARFAAQDSGAKETSAALTSRAIRIGRTDGVALDDAPDQRNQPVRAGLGLT